MQTSKKICYLLLCNYRSYDFDVWFYLRMREAVPGLKIQHCWCMLVMEIELTMAAIVTAMGMEIIIDGSITWIWESSTLKYM